MDSYTKNQKKRSTAIIVSCFLGALLYVAGIVLYIAKTIRYLPGSDFTREHIFNLTSMCLALGAVCVFLVYHIGYYKNGRFDSAVAISCALFALSLIVTVVKHISDAFYLSVYLGYEYGEVWHVLMPKLVAPLALCVLLTFFVVNYFKGRLSSFVLLLSAIFVLVSAVQGLTNQFADLAFSSNVDYNVAQAFILIGSVAQVIFFVAILIFVMNNYDDIAEENKGPVKKKLLTLVIVVLSVVVFVLIASPASVAIAQNIFSKW